MSRLMIIGCGGVASVAIHKCCQNSDVFTEIMIESRTVSKCDALKEKLQGTTKTKITTAKVDADNVDELVARCPLWLEAMDGAADKRLLVEKVMLSGRRIASASGMGGFGGKPMQKRVLGNLVLVGDFETDILEYPPLAPRVTEAAALLADAMLEFILTGVE